MRALLVFAVIVPLCGLLLVFSPQIAFFKSALSLPLSWPLATHPENEALHSGTREQQPLDVVGFSGGHKHSSSGHGHGHSHDTQPLSIPGQFKRKIVAVGDLHGDMPNAQAVLQMAGVVDAQGKWTGNVDVFVQTGDIIDRGDDTIKLYEWMDQLREQAHAAGGLVMSHLGNHEWMNIIGDWRYVYPSEIATFGSVSARQKMLSSGHIGKSWAANYTVTSRLPLHPSLGEPNVDFDPSNPSPLSHAAVSFVHGGLAPSYPDLTPFPSHINELGQSLLRKLQARSPPPPHPPNPYPGLPDRATPAERRLYGSDGPLWYRGWALDPEEKVCAEVDAVLKKTGTRRMIMGHTPDFEKIVSRCDGKIIVIDTGISHAYGGALSALSITYTLTPIANNKWREKEVVTALYEDQHLSIASDEREVFGDFAAW
ncbi:uncharacterized protein FIBRA_05195 [Fibroporia radiculosa]|uniref:Calcineurin-like phosphoesterase domain-containing protein n=1 Tax=Fibroporia radiculosa TaxID=599839 RepID=J4GQJ7_9APHY|nr:uncharacterized protein FIBRA_05195 [Fibroporia radiculosa]CCM03075.1 predicted protein [Fibroporia radiculosa]